MKVRRWFRYLFLITAFIGAPAFSERVQQQPDSTPQAQSAPSQTTLPQNSQPQGPAPLRVMVGKSLLVNTNEKLRRISITDGNIASAQVVTPTQILVHGKTPGEVSLLIWDELERYRSFDLRVDVDVSACAEEERRVFPDEQISVTSSRAAIVLSGHVSTEDVFKKAGELASAYSPKVVNVLTFGPVGAQEVLLQVKFAEVDRTALTQLGANFVSTGAGNTFGTTSTGQYGGFTAPSISTQSTTTSTDNNTNITTTKPTTQTTVGAVGLNNVLNLFLFRPDINFGVILQALQSKNLLQILAEPNLIAVNGKPASFLAGGQFPFPIVQPGQGFTAVTISFKEFGVKLDFKPEIMPNGNIHLHVTPEVSTLDFSNALTISGFTVPALSTRKADTEFELQDGQSFVIAGLMDNRVTDIYNKIPGLGDIPILGNFFRSKSAQKSNSELMVLCTVKRVSPSTEPPTLPKNVRPFLDDKSFDKSKN